MNKIQEIQSLLGVEADGQWGPKSEAALRVLLHPVAAYVGAAPLASERSERNIATLLPPVQEKARQLIALAEAEGIHIEVTSGTRTYEEQDALFNKGGVTKARGGQSNHNFGLAFDVTVFDHQTPIWESPNYKQVGAMGKSIGLSWGGDWQSFADEPHFELRPSWAESMSESEMLVVLRKKHDTGEDAFA